MLVNSYLLSSYASEKKGHENRQKAFQKKLVSQLFELAKDKTQRQKRVILCPNLLLSVEEHIRVLHIRKQDCRGCSLTRQIRKSEKCKALDEILVNQGSQKRPRSTVYG